MNTRKINNRADEIIIEMKDIIEAANNGDSERIICSIEEAEYLLIKLKEAAN